MPIFSSDLPVVEKHMGFDLKRCPDSKPLDAICTSENFLVTQTHFWGGRTVPHEIENCPACNKMQPYRTHVYLAGIIPSSREHFIFECSSNAAKAFDEYRNIYGTLRGCFFRASRPKGTRNGKVVIITRQADLQKCPLPEPPDLERALCVIWQIPYSKETATPTAIKMNGTKIDRVTRYEQLNPPNDSGGEKLLNEVLKTIKN